MMVGLGMVVDCMLAVVCLWMNPDEAEVVRMRDWT